MNKTEHDRIENLILEHYNRVPVKDSLQVFAYEPKLRKSRSETWFKTNKAWVGPKGREIILEKKHV